MIARLATMDEDKLHRLQQIVKWVVYTLLIVNFLFYFLEDLERARHVLHEGSTFLDLTEEFTTSIDELAWFVLLFMFELETYVLEDEEWKGWVAHVVRGARLACYVLLAHTVFAYSNSVGDYTELQPVENASSLCDLVDEDISYVQNLKYTEINAETCAGLSDANEFYRVANDPIVTDLVGFYLERDLAVVDLAEAVIWLVILLAIEVVVRMQGHNITGGPVISTLNRIKFLLYASLIGVAIYWAWLGHWLYLWDELLWIGGFAAIEMNVSEWRDEILEQEGVAT